MSPQIAGIVGFLALVVLIGLRIPIGVAMAVVGGIGTAYLGGPDLLSFAMGITPYEATSSYTLSVLPLFVMMGVFATYSGISSKLFMVANAIIGHFRGGLAMATVGASAGFSAICGSSLATSATMARIAIPEMQRYNYDMRLASGAVVAGGTLGIMIPPSLALAMYGILTQTSIGSLYLAAVIPGLLGAALYVCAVVYVTARNPEMGPRGERMPLLARLRALGSVLDITLLFGLILGGIFGGFFSVTEAAAIGVAGALLIAFYRGGLTWKNFRDGLWETASTIGMLFMILIGAKTFGFFIDLSGLPHSAVALVEGLSWPPLWVLVVILVIYILLGCVLDGMAMMLITIPVIFPIIVHLGIDPIWFGILMVTTSEIGLITPPFGMNLFVVQAVRPEISFGTMVRGAVPFIMADLVRLTILVAFPAVSLILLS